MKIKVFLTIALLVFPVFANPQKTKYIGFKHRGVLYEEVLPNGVKHLGGGLLTNEKYGVSRYEKGGKYMLWLEKITSRDASGVPSWVVKDVLIFGTLKKNEELMFSFASPCTQNGKPAVDLVVKAEVFPNRKQYKIKDVWKANTKREKFEKIQTKGVKCEFIEP